MILGSFFFFLHSTETRLRPSDGPNIDYICSQPIYAIILVPNINDLPYIHGITRPKVHHLYCAYMGSGLDDRSQPRGEELIYRVRSKAIFGIWR